MTSLSALPRAEKKKLPRRLRAAGIELAAVLPRGFSYYDGWWRDDDLVVTRIGDGWGFDRGVQFDGDWIRWVWFIGPRCSLVRHGRKFAEHLFATRATHLRWQVPIPDPRTQRFWERVGARLVALDPKAGHAFYELSRGAHPHQRTPRGFVIAPPRPAELDQLAEWAQRPEVYRPLGYEEGPTRTQLDDYLFPTTPQNRSHLTMRFFSVRRGDRLVGLANEHDWDYFGDSVRELDLALVDVDSGPGPLLDIMGGLMHRCYASGASHTLANMRAGASGRGFPRLFSRIGAHDITEQLHTTGAGQEGRRYYVATRSSFYASKEGRRWTTITPAA